MYRAATDIQPGGRGLNWPYPNANFHAPVICYILCVWGSPSNNGKDVIRLQDVTPDDAREQIYWRYPPPIGGKVPFPCGYSGKVGEAMGLPEVFGGGDAKTGPRFPAYEDPAKSGPFIYGAPDGVTDGIVLVLTSGQPNNGKD